MQGTIAFDGTLSGSIAGGGGGGGSEVTITPTLTEGEKIADFEIDGTPGELYAPTPTPLPEHIVNDIHGFSYTPYPSTEIARYTIDDGVEQSIYAPDYETTWEAYPGVDQDYTIGLLRCYGSTYNVKIPYYQKPLTPGTNISIDPDTNVISASGGGVINYSTAEQDTGELWTDGTSHVYQKSFQATLTGNSVQIDLSGLNISKAWIKDGFYDIGNTCLSLNEFIGGSAYCYTHINQGLNPPYIDCFNSISANSTIDITIKYIKNV